jgi:hypothetical protein
LTPDTWAPVKVPQTIQNCTAYPELCGEKKGGFVMQCDKNDYRGILLGLEGVTGKKAVDSDAMTVKN